MLVHQLEPSSKQLLPFCPFLCGSSVAAENVDSTDIMCIVPTFGGDSEAKQ